MKSENSTKKKVSTAQTADVWCPICNNKLSASRECPIHGEMRPGLPVDPKDETVLALEVSA